MFLFNRIVRVNLTRLLTCLCCMLGSTALAQDTAAVTPRPHRPHPVREKRDSIIQAHRAKGEVKKAQKKELAEFEKATQLGLVKAEEKFRDNNYQPGFWLGTNLLTMANPWEWGPSLTLEYRFNLHWAVGASYTAILNSMATEKNINQTPYDTKGFRFTANVKYFIPRGNRNRWFIGMEGKVKRLDYDIGRPHLVYLENYDNGILWQPERVEPRTLTSWGFAPIFGVQQMLGRRVQFEFYFGLGACYRSLNRHGAPSDANESVDIGLEEFIVTDGLGKLDKDVQLDRWTFNMPVCLRIAFLLNKPKH